MLKQTTILKCKKSNIKSFISQNLAYFGFETPKESKEVQSAPRGIEVDAIIDDKTTQLDTSDKTPEQIEKDKKEIHALAKYREEATRALAGQTLDGKTNDQIKALIPKIPADAKARLTGDLMQGRPQHLCSVPRDGKMLFIKVGGSTGDQIFIDEFDAANKNYSWARWKFDTIKALMDELKNPANQNPAAVEAFMKNKVTDDIKTYLAREASGSNHVGSVKIGPDKYIEVIIRKNGDIYLPER